MAKTGRKTRTGGSSKRLFLGAMLSLAAAVAGWYRDNMLEAETPFELPPMDFMQFQNWTLSAVQQTLNVSLSADYAWLEPCETIYDTRSEVATWHDPRLQLPDCITPPLLQGRTSSIAHAVAATLSDRFCIQSKAQKKVALGPKSIECGDAAPLLDKAWEATVRRGLFNNSQAGCLDEPSRKNKLFRAEKMCVTLSSESIMREVRANGPVVVLVKVYSDLLTYKGGVYAPSNSSERLAGNQPMELFGWGSDVYTASSFWLVKNSWGVDWGEQGFARLSREALLLDHAEIALTGSPLFEEEEPEPRVLTPVSPEELDLNIIV